MLAPTGTSRSTKRPSAPVTVLTTGEPDVGDPQRSHATPGVNGATAALGIYTTAL
jgi:hypothetical protein